MDKQSQFCERFNTINAKNKGWKICPLSTVSNVGSSKRVFVNELQKEGVPFFRGTEIGHLAEGKPVIPELFITKEHYERLIAATGIAVRGDLLLPSICPDGRIWQVDTDNPFYFKDGRVLWIHLNHKDISSTYLQYALKAIFEKRYNEIASGTTFVELKIFALKALEIVVPPLKEQEEFEWLIKQSDKSKKLASKIAEAISIAENIIGGMNYAGNFHGTKC